MQAPHSPPPARSETVDHSASEPAKSTSASHVPFDHNVNQPAAATPHPQSPAPDHYPSPPSVPSTNHETFTPLTPTGSPQVATNTAAAQARHRSMHQNRNFQPEFSPDRTYSDASSSTSPATLIKNLLDAAFNTLNTTIAAPARTLDSIKPKLQAPSIDKNSKSDIPNSLSQLERDMRHNQHAPGNLSVHTASQHQQANKRSTGAQPIKSDSANSLLRAKSKHTNRFSALMQRASSKSNAASRSSSRSSSARHVAPRPNPTATQEDGQRLPRIGLGPRGEEEDEEDEEDEEIVRQRIKDQQKRLEDLDEAQTWGLLRTQHEAGIEPPQPPTSASKPFKLVGLPLFGAASGSAKATQDRSEDAQATALRRSSFNRSTTHPPTQAHGSKTEMDNESPRATRHTNRPHRSNSEKLPSNHTQSRGRQNHARSASVSRAALTRRGSNAMSPTRRHSFTWTSKLRTKIPIKEFPLQGSGRDSEFDQKCPLWARQPWKYMYFSYFGLSVGLYHLPRWAVSSILPSRRGRPDWSWKKATMVKLFRHSTQLTFRTRTSLGRDLQKEVPHSKTVRCKFTWVDPVADDDVRGELRRAMLLQKVHPQRTCGFWYGDVAEHAKARKHRHRHGSRHGSHAHHHKLQTRHEAQPSVGATSVDTPVHQVSERLAESTASLGAASRDTDQRSQSVAPGGVGRPAEPGEKVLYHLHGGAYWIGTAHEKDVTAAVNTESLRCMAEIYKTREAEQKKASGNDSSASGADQNRAKGALSSSSTSMSGSLCAASSAYEGKLLRSFSLDYRLSVPGRPRAGSYPAALLDALSGYLYLVRDLGFKPENVILAGDSAGGNLALSLCRYLRDERDEIAKQPGSLLLMSPWVDVSRSHSGPTGAPNLDSTVYTNQKSDIISTMLAFRNTAVSAFLGDLPARETYRNPYISPVSLQLPLERGGKAPHYGFHGFPKRIYITTGSAEISYDQHLTLAHRLASGTRKGRPIYSGDRLSADCNATEMAERRNRPRPKEMLDADQNAITVTPLDKLQGLDLANVESARPGQAQHNGGEGAHSEGQHVVQVIDGEPKAGSNSTEPRADHESRDTSLLGERLMQTESQGSSNSNSSNGVGRASAGKARLAASPPPEPSNPEEREVILDEVKDAVHDYLLFKWFEPERSSTWRRIAQWIDEA